MTVSDKESGQGSRTVLIDRRVLACPECGWVHYAMTAEERAANDQILTRLKERYQLSEEERVLYDSAYRQCLRCESPASAFRAANEEDLDRPEGHIVTPVFVGAKRGMN
jgi:hypothetical protein